MTEEPGLGAQALCVIAKAMYFDEETNKPAELFISNEGRGAWRRIEYNPPPGRPAELMVKPADLDSRLFIELSALREFVGVYRWVKIVLPNGAGAGIELGFVPP